VLGPHLLGRIAPEDDAHLALHSLSIPTVANVEVEISRPTLNVYDQGDTPRCVAYSTSKVMNHYNQYAFKADWLYAECKKIDGFPGQDGTNARAACDVLRTKGHWRTIKGVPVKAGPLLKHGIQSNSWARDVDSIRSAIATTKHPVLIGIDWYDAWFDPAYTSNEYWLQDIDKSGWAAGGHEIGIWACSDRRQAFGLSNTWGVYWPKLVWLPYHTMTRLFTQGADACVIQDLATR
jgi:hypothetical protein